MYIFVDIYIYICIYINMYICIYMYIYMHYMHMRDLDSSAAVVLAVIAPLLSPEQVKPGRRNSLEG